MRFITREAKKPSQAGPEPGAENMQVLVLGLSPCATSSLQMALESDVLGLAPCMHMAHVAPYGDSEQVVLDAMREPDAARRQALLHTLFDGFRATCDYPGWYFAADLMDMYPEAAVVLNTRADGGAGWIRSFMDSLSFFKDPTYYLLCFLWRTDRLLYRIHRVTNATMSKRLGLAQMYTAACYDAHNEWLLAEARKRGRPVLKWKATDGWAPLCEFLGSPPPADSRPFPHLNDQVEMAMIRRVLIARGAISWALLAGAVWAGFRYGPAAVRGVVLPFIGSWFS